jgi:hypothetical protein
MPILTKLLCGESNESYRKAAVYKKYIFMLFRENIKFQE